MGQPKFIQIGESVHASIPKSAAAMKELLGKGADAYDSASEALDYIVGLIKDQAAGGADYIAVNVDAFGEDDPQLAVDLMRKYVKLVKRHSNGVPVCIDSSDDDVLKAGLEEWYADGADISAPLVNSVKTNTLDVILPLRSKYAFKVIGMLVEEEQESGGSTVDDLHRMAWTIFDAAVGKYGFSADDLVFDTTAFPLAIDLPMMPGTPSYTYRAFEAIRKITSDPQMKGVHASLGISNSVKDLPARKIGICRAYVAKGREYGLDAGIVNVMHDYTSKPADPELLELVEAFAKNDGSAEAVMKAMELMGQFCRENRK